MRKKDNIEYIRLFFILGALISGIACWHFGANLNLEANGMGMIAAASLLALGITYNNRKRTQ